MRVADAKSCVTLAETRGQDMGRTTVALRGLRDDWTQTVAEERARVASLVYAEISRVRAVVTLAL